MKKFLLSKKNGIMLALLGALSFISCLSISSVINQKLAENEVKVANFVDSYDVKRPELEPKPDKDNRDCFVEIKAFQNETDALYGTGIVIGNDGFSSYVLTNEHVLAKNNTCVIDDISYSTRIEYVSDTYDLAILKLYGKVVEPIRITTTFPEMGDSVSAVGNFAGNGITTTFGVVKVIGDMDTEGYGNGEVIVSDTLAYFGCSGGALVNKDGELVGLMRAIHTEKLLTYSLSIREIFPEIYKYVGEV